MYAIEAGHILKLYAIGRKANGLSHNDVEMYR